MRRELAAAAAGFVAMEPVAAGAHRFVMHGPGWVLHRSHHAPSGGWEANDAFPVAFAAATMGLMVLGTRVRALRLAVAVGAGVSAYGAAYAAVHEVAIHRRALRNVPLPAGASGAVVEWLRAAHGVHHQGGGAPYGMLLPLVPRRRAATAAFCQAGTRARREKTS